MRIILLSIILINTILYGCDPIKTNATSLLRLAGYFCTDTNITSMSADTNLKFLYTADSNKDIKVYEISKNNYPTANTLRINLKSQTKHTLVQDAISIVGSNKKVLVGSLDGTQAFRHAVDGINIGIISTNRTDVNGVDSILYQNRYAFIASKGELKVVDMASNLTTDFLSDPLVGNSAIVRSIPITDGNITDISIYKNIIYISYFDANANGRLQRYNIFNVNNSLTLENKMVYNIEATDIYANEEGLFTSLVADDLNNSKFTRSSTKTYPLNNLSSTTPLVSASTKAELSVGDRYYRVEVGKNGITIYKKGTNTVLASDNSFYGDVILSIGEHILVNDLTNNYIRVYKFGSISVNKTQAIAPFSSEFSVQKYNLDSIRWNFGDGSIYSSVEQNVTHLFQNAGNYIVDINTTFLNDITTKTNTQINLNVISDNIPELNISSNILIGQAPLSVNILSNVTYDRYINKVEINLGDGNITSSQNVNHIYNNAGEYNVSITAFYESDKNVSKSIIIKVLEGGSIKIGYPQKTKIASVGDFIDFSYILPTAINENNISYIQWNFGDGQVSGVANSKHTYAKQGNYNIVLNIVSADGTTAVMTKDIVIYPNEQYYISASKNVGEAPLEVSFNIKTSATVEGMPYISSTSCYSGGGAISFTDSFTSRFLTEGNNTVYCNLSLSDGTSKRISTIIEVDNTVKITMAKDTINAVAGTNQVFNATFFARSGVQNVLWDFGDGQKAYGTSANHIYSKLGTYNAKVTLTSKKNHVVTKNFFVNVTKTSISTSTTASQNVGEQQASVTIYATKLNNIYSYRFEAVIENYNDTISSYWWEFTPNRKKDIDKTTADYTFSSLSKHTINFKIRYKDNTISTHSYSFTIYDKKIQLVLQQGWNLISAPIDASFESISPSAIPPIGTLSMDTIKNRYVSLIWIFLNNTWVSNPKYIPRHAGIWVKSNVDYNVLSFRGGSSYLPSISSLSKRKWHLVGTGENIIDFYKQYSNYISSAHIYENGHFVKNPRNIKKGQGIWVHTR